jgi:ATP-binding cassette subfamily B protein
VQEALRFLLRGRTAIIIAHRLSTIRSADRIVVLEAGRVAEIGSHAELVSAGGHYARLHNAAAGVMAS